SVPKEATLMSPSFLINSTSPCLATTQSNPDSRAVVIRGFISSQGPSLAIIHLSFMGQGWGLELLLTFRHLKNPDRGDGIRRTRSSVLLNKEFRRNDIRLPEIGQMIEIDQDWR